VKPHRRQGEWRRISTILAMAGALALASGCARHGDAHAPLQAWGYAAWWLPLDAAQLEAARIDRLLFFEIALASDGTVADAHGWPERHAALRAAARNGTPLDLVLTLHGHEAFEALFSDPQARTRLLDTAERLARNPHVSGLQLDVEVYTAVSAESITGLRALVPALSARLRALRPQRTLSLFVPPAQTGLYDRASVSHADWAVMQAYDAHWAQSPEAGPVAPLRGASPASWEQALAHADALGVPRARALFSYPLYGYEWPMREAGDIGPTTGPGRTTTLSDVDPAHLPLIRTNVAERVQRFGCRHDTRSGSSSYRFFDPDRGWVAGWYEGAWSLRHKRRFAIDQRLAGVAFFVLGYDDFRVVADFERRRDAPSPPPPPC
jgi:spore germination protein